MVTNSKPISIESLKRRAKAKTKADGISHSVALDVLAKKYGYTSYRHLKAQQPQRVIPELFSRGEIRVNIKLLLTEQTVFRSIAVPATLTLDQLHNAIQAAMGWTRSHLHTWHIAGMHELVSTDDDVQVTEQNDERLHTIEGLIAGGITSVRYRYDLGDRWDHQIDFVANSLPEPSHQLTRLLEAEGHCPPEDSGGPYAYNRLVERAIERGHPDYEPDEYIGLHRWADMYLDRGYNPLAKLDKGALELSLSIANLAGYQHDKMSMLEQTIYGSLRRTRRRR